MIYRATDTYGAVLPPPSSPLFILPFPWEHQALPQVLSCLSHLETTRTMIVWVSAKLARSCHASCPLNLDPARQPCLAREHGPVHPSPPPSGSPAYLLPVCSPLAPGALLSTYYPSQDFQASGLLRSAATQKQQGATLVPWARSASACCRVARCPLGSAPLVAF